RDRVDCGRSVVTIASRNSAGLHLEFLHRIGKGQRQIQVVMQIVVIGAIQQISDAASGAAGDRDGLRRIIAIPVETGGRDRRSNREDQVRQIAAVQWKFQNALVVDDLADAGAARFHHRDIRLDLDSLRYAAYLENNIDRGVAVDLQYDSGLNVRGKTAET